MTDLNPYATPESPLTTGSPAQAELLTEPRKVTAGRGWGWIAGGFDLFKLDPWIWIVNSLILFVILFLLGLVPLGSIASYLLHPIFQGGLMLGCYALDSGGRLQVEHLFAGFKTNAGSLAAVGGLYILGSIAIAIVVMLLIFLLGGRDIFGLVSAVESGTQPNPQETVQLAYLGIIAVLIGLALIVPLAMAIWFAPALVVFHSLGAVEAMKLSFRGCLRNILPFLIYGLIALVLMVLAIIPVLLGLLVLVPTLIASIYIGYKDIFLKT